MCHCWRGDAQVRQQADRALTPILGAAELEEVIDLLADPRIREQAEVVSRVVGRLKRSAGVDFGKDVERWRAWWREMQARDLLEPAPPSP